MDIAQLIIDNQETIIGGLSFALGWVAVRLKDKIAAYVKGTPNTVDDAIWSVIEELTSRTEAAEQKAEEALNVAKSN